MNSPDSLSHIYALRATQDTSSSGGSSSSGKTELATAELIRETALKCISFNGIPRTINCLNAFRTTLPEPVAGALSKQPTRLPTSSNIDDIRSRGRQLWDSIYRPFEDKLYEKLGEAHPDLPVYILNFHYGALLADPPADGVVRRSVKSKDGNGEETGVAGLGRLLTSVVAVACLRAQTGVGPQVLSHVFGLRKAIEDGTWVEDGESEEGARWLTGEEGNTWILNSVDEIVEAIGEGRGSSFAAGKDSKL